MNVAPLDMNQSLSIVNASNSICYELTREEVIFSRNEEVRFSFVERTWNKYLDYKPVMKSIRHEFAE